MILNNHDIRTPKMADKLMSLTDETLTIELEEGPLTLPTRHVIFHLVLWYPLIQANLPITKNDIFDLSAITTDFLSDVQTHLFNRLLDHPSLDYMTRIRLIWENANKLRTFIITHLRAYVHTLDAFSIYELRQHPEIKELSNVEIDQNLGPTFAEHDLADRADKLTKIVSRNDLGVYNPLWTMIKTKNLNAAQFPQIFLACGTRSDVDTSVKRHIISRSFISGLRSAEDYATEALASKLSAYLSTTAIKDSNGFGRVLRLICTPLEKIHRGSCGHTLTFPHYLNPIHGNKYAYTTIADGPQKVTLDKSNLDRYLGKVVEIISPYGCRHQNGVCEACFGWGYGRAADYTPPVNIGEACATWLVNESSQNSLSTKHRVVTSSKEIMLSDAAKKFFWANEDGLFLHGSKFLQAKGLFIRIPNDFVHIRPLTDLLEDYEAIASTFSKIESVIIVDNNHHQVSSFPLSSETNSVCLSLHTLHAIEKAVRNNVVLEDKDFVYIPLEILPTDLPVMDVSPMSADMEAFIRKLRSFFNQGTRGLASHTSIPNMMTAFTDLCWSKLKEINLPAMMMISRAMLIDPCGDYHIPIITDVNNVTAGTLRTVSRVRSVSMALAHSCVPGWLSESTTYTIPRGPSVYNPIFGLRHIDNEEIY